MFAWAAVPRQFAELGSLRFAELLAREGRVAVSPGVGFGPGGEGFVRFALVENEHRIRQAVRGISRIIKTPAKADEEEAPLPSPARSQRRDLETVKGASSSRVKSLPLRSTVAVADRSARTDLVEPRLGLRVLRPNAYDATVADRIVSLVPAETGWRALYAGEHETDAESARIVAWALLEGDEGSQQVVGLVVSGADPTSLVPAPAAASELAPRFERYGFKAE